MKLTKAALDKYSRQGTRKKKDDQLTFGKVAPENKRKWSKTPIGFCFYCFQPITADQPGGANPRHINGGLYGHCGAHQERVEAHAKVMAYGRDTRTESGPRTPETHREEIGLTDQYDF